MGNQDIQTGQNSDIKYSLLLWLLEEEVRGEKAPIHPIGWVLRVECQNISTMLKLFLRLKMKEVIRVRETTLPPE